MTVKELIDKLQEIPDKDKEITLEISGDQDSIGCLFEISGIKECKRTMIGECYSIYHD